MSAEKRVGPANRLLAAISRRSRLDLSARCEQIDLSFAQVIFESGDRIRYVYFPIDSFISLVTALDDGARLEVGIIGDEGMLGASLILGVSTAPQHAIVQGAGCALRMTTGVFRRHFAASGALRQELNRYIYVLMSQLEQTVACVNYHRLEARLACWLLLTRDRAHSTRFRLTHEFLAYMLGVRRVGVTQAASALQARGLIIYSRGEITIVDEPGLALASCPCYRQANATYDRMLAARRPIRRRIPPVTFGAKCEPAQ